jgi:hypothetical protein
MKNQYLPLQALTLTLLIAGLASPASHAFSFKASSNVETTKNSHNDSSQRDSNNDSSHTDSGNTAISDAYNTLDSNNTSDSNNKDNITTQGDVWSNSMDRIKSHDLEGAMSTVGDRFQSHNISGNANNANFGSISAGNSNTHIGGRNEFVPDYDATNNSKGGSSYGGNGSSIATNKAKAKGTAKAKSKPKAKGKVKVKKGGDAQGHEVYANSNAEVYNNADAYQNSAGYGGVSDASGGDAYSAQSFDNAHVQLGDTIGDNFNFDNSISQTITYGDVNMGGK